MSLRSLGILKIPELTDASNSSINTSQNQIDGWIAQLPLADAVASARLIIEFLDELNHLDIVKRQRQKILEPVIQPALRTAQSLKQHYIKQGMPLSDKHRESALLVLELYTKFATGYKIFIDQTWHSNISLISKKIMAQVIYRAIYFLSEILLVCYEIYRDPPADIWLQIHQLYLYAEEGKINYTKIKGGHRLPDSNSTSSSIANLYKRILLVSLISPYRLRQLMTDKVYKALEKWSDDTHLISIDEVFADPSKPVINLDEDDPPKFQIGDLSSLKGDNIRALDTSDLITRLNEILLLQRNFDDTDTDKLDIPYNITKKLLVTWSGDSQRAFLRSDTSNKLNMTVGLSATHSHITELSKNDAHSNSGLCESALAAIWDLSLSAEQIILHKDPKFEDPANFANMLNFQFTANSENIDYWDAEYTNKSIGSEFNLKLLKNQAQQNLQHDMAQYAPLNCNNINESANGLCLLGHIEKNHHSRKIKIGELVGLCDNIETTIDVVNIGVIRRIKCTDTHIELGIQKLATCAESVAASTYQMNSKNLRYARSLILPELKSINQPVTLITHNLHKLDDRLILNKLGYKTIIRLTKLIDSTENYSQFEFSISDIIGFGEVSSDELENNEPSQKDWSII